MRVLTCLILSLLACLYVSEDQSALASPGSREAEPFELMWQLELPGSDHLALLFYHRRDGGIYIRQQGEDQAALKTALWRGWWPLHFYAPVWLDESNLAFRGTFITGVGPAGNRPFDATLRFSYDGNRWQRLEPELSEPPFEKPIQLDCGSMEGIKIRNERALDMLQLYPADVSVDYAKQRLILLHDPAVSVLEPQIMTSESGYHLVWVGEGPLRASAYARPGTIWIVLPDDGKSLYVVAGADMERCIDCRTGVAMQPLLRWIFTPANPEQKPAANETPLRQQPCRPVGPSGAA
jgi:hypothetical protein